MIFQALENFIPSPSKLIIKNSVKSFIHWPFSCYLYCIYTCFITILRITFSLLLLRYCKSYSFKCILKMKQNCISLCFKQGCHSTWKTGKTENIPSPTDLGPCDSKLPVDPGAAQVWCRSSCNSFPTTKHGIQQTEKLGSPSSVLQNGSRVWSYREHQVYHLLLNFKWKNCYATKVN